MSEQGASSAAQQAAAADPLAAAHARLLLDRSIQFSFESLQIPKPPAWLDDLLRALAWLGPVLKWLFWIGLAVGIAAILFFLARELLHVRWPGRSERPGNKQFQPEAWRPEASRARALLEDADRLAAEGRFAEAAHLLLYRSIDDIEGRRPRLVRPALTARDISAHEGLPAAARVAFGTIAQVVETSFFGGRDVDAQDFAQCRSAYEAFAFPEAWA